MSPEENLVRTENPAEHSAAAVLFDTAFEQDAMGMALRAVDPNNARWLRVNQKFCDMLGYTREELLQLTSVDISLPEERFIAVRYNEKLLKGDLRSYSRDKRYLRKDGTAIWTNVWLSAVLDSEGSPTQIISVIQDITERKDAAQQLEESRDELEHQVAERTADLQMANERLTQQIADRERAEDDSRKLIAAINAMNECVTYYDADDRLVFSNQRHRVLNAAVPETLVPGSTFEVHMKNILAANQIPEALGSEDDWLRERMDRHRNPSGPFEVLRQDGICLLVHEQRLADGGTITLATDITERKLAEEARRQSEERFRVAFENAPVGVALITLDGNRFKVNKALADFLGYSVEELTDTKMKSTAADLDDLDESLRRRQQVLDGEITTYRNERRYRHQQGHVVWGEVSGSLIRNKDGEPEHFIAHTIDITERKRAEQELRDSEELFSRTFHASPVLTAISRPKDGSHFDVNRTWMETMGYSHEEAMAHSALELGIWADVKQRARFVELLGQEGSVRDFEAKFRTKDGRQLDVLVAGEQIFVHGDPRLIVVTHDITERKQAEEQLRQSQKMEAVGQLTAGVAHDFNNMLAVIWGNAELLEDQLGKGNSRLATMYRATQRAADLTQRLLAFSRRQVLNPEIMNANSLIFEIIGLLGRSLEEHIDIETVISAGLWNCEVDPAQLENALINLALNARDAMPDGGKLTIETANAQLDDDFAATSQTEVTPGQYVMLAITDTGTGMPPEVQEHVFEPFFTTKEVGDGSGLGLSMVYGFVKQSGGHVTITSEVGEGTTIKLYLPRSAETDTTDKIPVVDETPAGRGETVLVVEDDPDLRELAIELLNSLGYQVVEAATGAEALEQLETTAGVNLLLTDLVLPGGMNGRELGTEVTQRYPEIRVLHMSGYAGDAIMHHGRLDADAALLQKPFRRSELARAVRDALDGPS